MKFLVQSDLHLEYADFEPVCGDYDAVILAGDIDSRRRRAVQWAAKAYAGKPVVLVAGNHEFFHSTFERAVLQMRAAARGTPVHFLDRGELVCGSVRILGCTLWTGFDLRITQPNGELPRDPLACRRAAELDMPDYAFIHVADAVKPGSLREKTERLIRSPDVIVRHQLDAAWLLEKLEEPFAGKTVVVTHHAPHRGSLCARYAHDWLSGAFVNDLPERYFKVPALWVHGHTHQSFDYFVGNCRILCNPRGYIGYRAGGNPRFKHRLIVDL